MNFIIKVLLSALAVMVAAYLLPGVTISSFGTAIILALVLALLNVTLKPLLIILTIPVTILTLGLFLLVINALIILAADALISGFNVDGFLWALIFSIILSVVTAVFEAIAGND